MWTERPKLLTTLVLHRTINKVHIPIHINYSKSSNKCDPGIFLLRERAGSRGSGSFYTMESNRQL